MQRVPWASRAITSLIKVGVEIDSGAPSFLYTKLSELKINMLAEATKDATSRAEQIVGNARGRLGKLVEARMGVIQINPKGSVVASCAKPKFLSAAVSIVFQQAAKPQINPAIQFSPYSKRMTLRKPLLLINLPLFRD